MKQKFNSFKCVIHWYYIAICLQCHAVISTVIILSRNSVPTQHIAPPSLHPSPQVTSVLHFVCVVEASFSKAQQSNKQTPQFQQGLGNEARKAYSPCASVIVHFYVYFDWQTINNLFLHVFIHECSNSWVPAWGRQMADRPNLCLHGPCILVMHTSPYSHSRNHVGKCAIFLLNFFYFLLGYTQLTILW